MTSETHQHQKKAEIARLHDIARHVRNKAALFFQAGRLTAFHRAYAQGEINLIHIWMPHEKWVIQGIENEIDFLCSRATEAGQ